MVEVRPHDDFGYLRLVLLVSEKSLEVLGVGLECLIGQLSLLR